MPHVHDERGFSLAELLVTFAALALVLAAVTTIERQALQVYVSGANKTEAQQNARIALERIARELRQTSGALTAATASTLTLIDQGTGLAVTYTLAGDSPNASLTRTTNGATDVLLGGVQSLTFAYAYCGGCGAAAANVRRVDVTVRTKSEDAPVAAGPADMRTVFTTSVQLRNL